MKNEVEMDEDFEYKESKRKSTAEKKAVASNHNVRKQNREEKQKEIVFWQQANSFLRILKGEKVSDHVAVGERQFDKSQRRRKSAPITGMFSPRYLRNLHLQLYKSF